MRDLKKGSGHLTVVENSYLVSRGIFNSIQNSELNRTSEYLTVFVNCLFQRNSTDYRKRIYLGYLDFERRKRTHAIRDKECIG